LTNYSIYDTLQPVGIKVIPLDNQNKKEVYHGRVLYFSHCNGPWNVWPVPLPLSKKVGIRHTSISRQPPPRNSCRGLFLLFLKFVVK